MNEDDERSAKANCNLLASQHYINIALITVTRQLNRIGWTYAKARFDPMIRLTNKDLRVLHAQAWIKSGETFNNVIFTDESTVALEQFAQNCYKKIKISSSKPSPKHPLKLHVWGGGAIPRQGPGPYLIFDGKFGYLQSKRYIKYCSL
ncbi:unnamed protein product [Oncorhynchus mykiss]|uniref:Transposase Tc1-like domain-containing protein n=1 Tax=Oncorhynchus mykiss TaxID=8022 RepID=A0A060Z9N0_ONCMY|nr:unnamed protein product [Oncorhynchus mykiss]